MSKSLYSGVNKVYFRSYLLLNIVASSAYIYISLTSLSFFTLLFSYSHYFSISQFIISLTLFPSLSLSVLFPSTSGKLIDWSKKIVKHLVKAFCLISVFIYFSFFAQHFHKKTFFDQVLDFSKKMSKCLQRLIEFYSSFVKTLFECYTFYLIEYFLSVSLLYFQENNYRQSITV